MSRQNGLVDETSPLLPSLNSAERQRQQQDQDQDQDRQRLGTHHGVAPEGGEGERYGDYDDDDEYDNEGSGNGVLQPHQQQDRQRGQQDGYKYVGMPQVKKQMKYIFPALAIGVRTSHLFPKKKLLLGLNFLQGLAIFLPFFPSISTISMGEEKGFLIERTWEKK